VIKKYINWKNWAVDVAVLKENGASSSKAAAGNGAKDEHHLLPSASVPKCIQHQTQTYLNDAELVEHQRTPERCRQNSSLDCIKNDCRKKTPYRYQYCSKSFAPSTSHNGYQRKIRFRQCITSVGSITRTGTGEKSFACNLCEAKFANKGGIVPHIRPRLPHENSYWGKTFCMYIM